MKRAGVTSDDGFTLIELSVAGALMSLIAVLVATTVAGGVRTAARAEKRTDDAGRAQLALLLMTADIRAADDVLEATPSRLRLTTRVPSSGVGAGGSAEEVRYDLSAGNLVMTRTPSGGVTSTRTVLPFVLPPAQAGRPLFRMLSRENSARQCSTGPTVGTLEDTATGAVTGTNLDRIYAVEVWLSVNSAPNLSRAPLVLSGGAVLANTSAAIAAGIDTATGSLGIGQGCS